MQVAVNYYLEHGRSITRTIRAIGYPSRDTLKEWIDKLIPGERKVSIKRSAVVKFTQDQKKTQSLSCAPEKGLRPPSPIGSGPVGTAYINGKRAAR